MRILLDTNILISGLLSPGGPPGKLVDAWLAEEFVLVCSEEQRAELRRALNYEHIASRVSEAKAISFTENLDGLADIVTNLPVLELSPDPDDNIILATASAGRADLVVSGDKKDVLALGEVNGIPIITAREAVERLGLEEQ